MKVTAVAGAPEVKVARLPANLPGGRCPAGGAQVTVNNRDGSRTNVYICNPSAGARPASTSAALVPTSRAADNKQLQQLQRACAARSSVPRALGALGRRAGQRNQVPVTQAFGQGHAFAYSQGSLPPGCEGCDCVNEPFELFVMKLFNRYIAPQLCEDCGTCDVSVCCAACQSDGCSDFTEVGSGPQFGNDADTGSIGFYLGQDVYPDTVPDPQGAQVPVQVQVRNIVDPRTELKDLLDNGVTILMIFPSNYCNDTNALALNANGINIRWVFLNENLSDRVIVPSTGWTTNTNNGDVITGSGLLTLNFGMPAEEEQTNDANYLYSISQLLVATGSTSVCVKMFNLFFANMDSDCPIMQICRDDGGVVENIAVNAEATN